MNTGPLRVGLIGLGTVGSGVAHILIEQPERMTRRAGRPLHIARVAVRSPDKPRSITLPDAVVSDDVRQIIEDDSIDVAVQLIGGTDPAGEIMQALLRSGKDVVTANKALLCEHGTELFQLARENGRCIAFEAAVAGGIPIVAALGQSMAANQITSIEAILNGTSNFILTEMLAGGRSYEDVLAEAQKRGYAEADPSMDVDGTDAAQKLVILVRLAFGKRVSLHEFALSGIDMIELADLRYADELGYAVKLLAVAKLVDRQLEMHVQPTLLRRDRPIARTDGAFNIIALEGDAVGTAWFSGPGAGQLPTASAVVADLIDVATGRAARTFSHLDVWRPDSACALQLAEQISRRYYLRFKVEDRPHVLADIADILGRNEISIASVIQHEAPEHDEAASGRRPVVPLVIMTHLTTEGRMRAADRELAGLSSLQPKRVRMPVAD